MIREQKQRGFSAIELVLVIVIVCLLGVVGYLVISLRNQHTSPASSTSTKASLSASDSANITSRARYVIQYDTDNHGPDVAQQLQQKGYFTQKLADYINQQNNASPEGAGEDIIICAQATPDSLTFGTPQLESNGKTVDLVVTGNYSISGPNNIATTWLKTAGVWQEDSITCSNR
jgi:prepilin-type N-terminal cleavage/methylation domain-containing protein